MSGTADAVVIGAGILGASITLELTRLGFRVVAVDSGEAAGTGATRTSGAIIFHHGWAREGTLLSWESYHQWKGWNAWVRAEDPRGSIEFRECGCLALRTEENHFLERQMNTSDELGILYEVWDTATLNRRLPYLCLDSFAPARTLDDVNFGTPNGRTIEEAILWPQTGFFIDPQLAAANLQHSASCEGAIFRFGVRVTDVCQAGGRVAGVRLSNGDTIDAPIVVNVAGPASSVINRLAGADADMAITSHPVRQEVALVPFPDTFDIFRDGFILSDSDTGCCARPSQRNFLMVFSQNPEFDENHLVDSSLSDREPTERIALYANRLAQRIPGLRIPDTPRGMVDFYDVSDDWLPIYDRSCLPGFYMAVGSSGNQYRNAPAAGLMMSQLVQYCENGNDHDRHPLICELPNTGSSIDLSFYSRLREPHEGSLSVMA